MTMISLRRLLVGGLVILLSGCLLSPGKFISALDVRKDGSFTYSYAGEIHMLALSKLAQSRGGGSADFAAQPCLAASSSGQLVCTDAEIDRQKREWAEEQRRAADRRKREGESMKAMLGGIDMSDPRAAEELAARLRRQAGWRRVDYKGDGLFDVDFTLTGTLDHDFSFPSIERLPMANAFLTIARRKDGSLRVDAPGFGNNAAGGPLQAIFQSMGMASTAAKSAATGQPANVPGLPLPDGRFTITTDAAIIANNTDEGPQPDARGQRLDWTITLRSAASPMALLRLVQHP